MRRRQKKKEGGSGKKKTSDGDADSLKGQSEGEGPGGAAGGLGATGTPTPEVDEDGYSKQPPSGPPGDPTDPWADFNKPEKNFYSSSDEDSGDGLKRWQKKYHARLEKMGRNCILGFFVRLHVQKQKKDVIIRP